MANQTEPLHARPRARRRTVDWAPAYFAALEASGGSFKKSARAAHVAYSTVWERRQQEPQFAAAEDLAVKRAQRMLESEAIRRAVEGTKLIRFQPKTGKIYHDLQFSDTLLLRLLEKNETGSWRQKHQLEHSGGIVGFKTRADRKAALAEARRLCGKLDSENLNFKKTIESRKELGSAPPNNSSWRRSDGA